MSRYPLLTVTDESAGGAEQLCGRWSAKWRGGASSPRLPLPLDRAVSGELFSTGEPCTQPDDYERRRIEHEDRVMDFVHRCAREGKPST